MIEQRRQQIAAMMDDDIVSDEAIDQLVRDPDMRSMWSRFHLVSDLIKKDVPKAIDPQFESRVFTAISNEPTILAPAAIKPIKPIRSKTTVISNIRGWAEQATGFAIAASVTVVMVYGVQTMNIPSTIDNNRSAITALEFLEVDELQIAEQPVYSDLQEDLLDFTRTSSQYGLQAMSPYASVVNHSITVPLTLIKSNFDTILDETETQSGIEKTERQPKK